MSPDDAEVTPSDSGPKLDRTDQEAVERAASSSEEFPTKVTRSTQDLTTGGTKEDPKSHTEMNSLPEGHASPPKAKGEPSPEPVDGPTRVLSNAEQATENQEQALESGAESPG